MKRTPFRNILVANRGEIALRIMRTARRLGYGVVAVYSDADRARFMCARRMRPSASVRHCRRNPICGSRRSSRRRKPAAPTRCIPATAFWPRTRISPAPAGMRAWCSSGRRPKPSRRWATRLAPRTIMQAAGVPCVPGYQGADQSDGAMFAAARTDRISRDDQGGRRRRRSRHAAGQRCRGVPRIRCAVRDPRRRARSAIRPSILERAIADPRHIEIQVFGDAFGHAIHLGERDCSVQRRHQKLIEEAPSPAVSPELRARMGAVAVAAVKSIRI